MVFGIPEESADALFGHLQCQFDIFVFEEPILHFGEDGVSERSDEIRLQMRIGSFHKEVNSEHLHFILVIAFEALHHSRPRIIIPAFAYNNVAWFVEKRAVHLSLHLYCLVHHHANYYLVGRGISCGLVSCISINCMHFQSISNQNNLLT